MNIKQRLKALELQYKVSIGNEPWLVFEIDGKPTPAQQESMDEADRQGRTYICFIMDGDTVYHSLQKESPPWLE